MTNDERRLMIDADAIREDLIAAQEELHDLIPRIEHAVARMQSYDELRGAAARANAYWLPRLRDIANGAQYETTLVSTIDEVEEVWRVLATGEEVDA